MNRDKWKHLSDPRQTPKSVCMTDESLPGDPGTSCRTRTLGSAANQIPIGCCGPEVRISRSVFGPGISGQLGPFGAPWMMGGNEEGHLVWNQTS